MAIINLPYGKASFDTTDLVQYVTSLPGQYIIQGQVNCKRQEHPKPQSLDVWLRDNYAKNPDIKQAVTEVIKDLVATGDFEEGKFQCPESGRLCKGIKIIKKH